MAVDTRDKRASAAQVQPFMPQLPTPDGTISDSDRKQCAFLYRGIVTSTVVAIYRAVLKFFTGNPRLEANTSNETLGFNPENTTLEMDYTSGDTE